MGNSITFQGSNDYRGFYAGTLTDLDLGDGSQSAPSGTANASPFASFVAGARASDSIKVGNTLTIETGTGFLVGAVGDDNGNVAPGTRKVQVLRPDGTALSASGTNDPNELVVLDSAGNIRCFVIRNPAAGVWSFDLKFDSSTTDIHFLAHTIPSADVSDTMVSTLEQVAERNRQPRTGGLRCTLCKVAYYALGVIIAGLLVLLAVLVTDGAALVGMAELLAIETTSAMALLRGLAFVGTGLSIGFIAANICAWLGVCVPDTPLSVALTAPVAGATVRSPVELVASVTGTADLVQFYADGVLVAQDDTAPDFRVSWSPTAGSHVLIAQAFKTNTDAEKTVIAVSNEVTVTATA